MTNSNRIIILFLFFAMLFVVVTPRVYAAEESLTLQYVIIKLENETYLRVPFSEYGIAYLSNTKGNANLLWKFLKGNMTKPNPIYAVASGDKYMKIADYGIKYLATKKINNDQKLGYSTAKIISESIKAAYASAPIPVETVLTYYEVEYIKDANGKTIGVESKPLSPTNPPIEEFRVISIE